MKGLGLSLVMLVSLGLAAGPALAGESRCPLQVKVCPQNAGAGWAAARNNKATAVSYLLMYRPNDEARAFVMSLGAQAGQTLFLKKPLPRG